METKKKRKTLDEYLGVTGKNVTVLLIIAIIASVFVGGILAIVSPILGLYCIYYVIKQRKDPSTSHNTKILRVVLIIVWLLVYGFFASLKNSPQQAQGNQVQNSVQTNTGWQTFSSVDGDFKINFPKYPEKEISPISKANGVTINSTTYSSNESDNDTYMVAVYSYDIAPDNYNVKNGLEGMVNGFVNNIKGASLSNSSFTMFGPYQAVDFTVNSPDQDTTFNGRAIVRNDLAAIKAYLLVSGSVSGVAAKHDQFINSFSITQ